MSSTKGPGRDCSVLPDEPLRRLCDRYCASSEADYQLLYTQPDTAYQSMPLGRSVESVSWRCDWKGGAYRQFRLFLLFLDLQVLHTWKTRQRSTPLHAHSRMMSRSSWTPSRCVHPIIASRIGTGFDRTPRRPSSLIYDSLRLVKRTHTPTHPMPGPTFIHRLRRTRVCPAQKGRRGRLDKVRMEVLVL